jgi:hypothetical protein
MPDEVRHAADLRDEVVGKAAAAEAVGDEIEVTGRDKNDERRYDENEPEGGLAPKRIAPRRAAAALDEEQRGRQRDRGFARREGEDEEERGNRPGSFAQVREHCGEIEARHERGRAAADVGHRLGLHGVQGE